MHEIKCEIKLHSLSIYCDTCLLMSMTQAHDLAFSLQPKHSHDSRAEFIFPSTWPCPSYGRRNISCKWILFAQPVSQHRALLMFWNLRLYNLSSTGFSSLAKQKIAWNGIMLSSQVKQTRWFREMMCFFWKIAVLHSTYVLFSVEKKI